MRVTIRDIAAQLGLSTATVSLALNDNPRIREVTRKRVREAAEQMGYSPNPYARNLVLGRSGNIGLIVPDIQNTFYASLVHYINQQTAAAGYRLTILISNESWQTERNLVRDLEQYNVEAILLTPACDPGIDREYIRHLNELETPLVFVSARHPGVQAPCAMSDLAQGMRDAALHVAATGAKRVAFLTGPRGVPALDVREDVCRKTLEEAGIAPEVLHARMPDYENAHELVQCMRNLPDTLMCVNDMMAMGAQNALSERGVGVPRDIRVTGFDDGLYARVSATPITSVRQDLQAIASASIEMALRLIRGETLGEAERERMIPCQLLPRRSTEI